MVIHALFHVNGFYSLGADTQTHTHTHTDVHTKETRYILAQASAWFKYRIHGNFRGMYISRIAVEPRFLRSNLRLGYPAIELSISHTCVRTPRINFHGLNFHCGSFNREIRENYMPRTFPGIRYQDFAILMYCGNNM